MPEQATSETVEFNSSTLYRYANVNVSELRKTLDDAADVAVVVRQNLQKHLSVLCRPVRKIPSQTAHFRTLFM